MSHEEVSTSGSIANQNSQLSSEDSLKDEIRRFTTAVNDSSLRIHGMAFSSLTKYIEREDAIPEAYVKGLVKISVSTSIRRYIQPKSFRYVAKLINALAKHDFLNVIRTFAQTVNVALLVVPNLSPAIAATQVPTSKWLLSLFFSSKFNKLNQQDVELAVSALATLSYYTSASPSAWKIFLKKLSYIHKLLPERIQCIEKEITNLCKDHPETSIVLLSAISVVSKEARLAPIFVDLLAKTVLLPKTRPPQYLIERAGDYMPLVKEKEFNDGIVPNIKKALLRSPEVSIYGIQEILERVSFTLDVSSPDILKAVTSSLQSTDEALRNSSVSVVVALCMRAQSTTITKIINTLFDQLSVSKVAENRISILRGIAKIGDICECCELDKIADDVINKTAKVEKDCHDGTVEAQWNAATAWATRLSKVTPALVTAFKEVNKLHPTLKYIAFRSLFDIFENRKMVSLPDGIDAKPLLAEIESFPKGELSLFGLALLLLKTYEKGSIEHTKIWSVAAHVDSIFKEKTLAITKWQDAIILSKLVETVVLQRPIVDKNAKTTYSSSSLRLFSLVLFWPHWKVREQALESLVKVLEVEKASFAEALAEIIYSETINGNIDNLLRKVPACPNGDWVVPGEWYVKILRILLTPTGPELDKLAIHTLLMASLQRLVEVDGSVWIRWIHEHRESKTWQANESFRETAINKVFVCKNRGVRDTALMTLVSLNDEQLKNDLWKHVEEGLKNIEVDSYMQITDGQIAIYKCPDGQLYNTSVLDFDEAAGIKGQKGNYQDQLAEIQLIRELAEKRRKEGKLSAKQKQVMDKELASEKEIRDSLKNLFGIAETKLDEVRAVVKADHVGAFYRSPIIFDYCLPLTKSKLVCEQAARLFIAYRDGCFEHSDDYLEELVASSWLRVMGSPYKIQGWSEEPLSSALKRMFSLLNERAFIMDTGDDDADEVIFDDDVVGASHLILLYPMIRAILTNDKYSVPSRNDALQFLQNAIHKKFLRDREVLNIPMEQYASLLLEYYANHVDSLAFKAVQQIMRLANDTNDIGDRILGMVREVGEYVTHEKHEVRIAALQVLSAPQLLVRIVIERGIDSTIVRDLLVRVFVARFDPMEQVSDVADRVWTENHIQIRTIMGCLLVDECVSPFGLVRESAAHALYAYIEELPDEMNKVLTKLDDTYKDLLVVRGAVFDDVGRMKRDAFDEFERRSGVGKALVGLSTIIGVEDAVQLIKITTPDGLADRSVECRNELRNAAVETIRRHGANILSELLPFLENLLDTTPSSADHDNRRQGLVVLLGTLAQYIDSTDKVKSIVLRLLEALSTPSQSVQESVSRCLAPLVPKIRQVAKDHLGKLQWTLFEGSTYGERRGAAYGIAGLVKGMGVIALKDIDLLASVRKHMEDKKSPNHREGGLLALEIMCSTIGKLFEPYILKTLPALLLAFGDNDSNVRQAAEDTAKAMMAGMTVYGTKLVLPSLLTALDDDSWRTKCAATELLGSMAFCAPRQLSSCLPNIVPKLIEVLADSSTKVQKSGEKALQQIAKVVRNPEILGVTNQLMTGLLDPANKTSMALQAVLNTKFIHYIDAPSLALMMPIVRRAFEDRNSETRRVAAQIISNIYSLTENKDMEPYLAHMVPGLQRSLLDPVPEIRTVSSRALGAVVSKAGGATSENLRAQVIPWLKEKLVSQQSTVDRSGAAQGLCEVLAGIGTDQLDVVMPELIESTNSPDVSAETRDGYLLMYIYLPMVYGDRFIPYLPQVVPPILKALADENEYVRASALKAGQRLISQYCSHARKLLLPELQLALMDENWRIRHASVQLIGDFLFNISGISGKSTSSTADEDDTMGMEQAGKTIVRALGQKDRDRVLAGLYLTRSDVALVVRQAAGHVWKMVVTNTPRTLKEVMKVLFELVVDSLASSCDERQQIGARCLGELVRKMGDKVINEILPVLDLNQKSEDVSKRVGVAIALHEIIANMSREVTNHYLESIVGPVREAICDEDGAVREAAADTFTCLYHVVGNEALDDIITPLLEKLTPDEDHILAGLCDVMKQNSKSMLPYLLPKLTKPPVNVHALCSLASVSGDSLSRQLPKVLDALLASCVTNDENDPMIESCEKVVTAVTDEDGIPVLLDYLIKRASSDSNVPAAVLLHTFISESDVDLSEMAEEVLPGLLNLYTSSNSQIIDHVIGAAILLTQNMDQRVLQQLLPITKKAINIVIAGAKGAAICGFGHVKSLQPIVGIVRESILQGSAEIKAMAAEMLGQVVGVSEVAALKSHVVSITGPLIRVLGDRYPASVKLPIIETLSKLLDKVDGMLRPFLPQLQSTFLKALQELSSRQVRLAAGGALARLIKLHPKPESTITELIKFLMTCKDENLLESSLAATRALVGNCGPKLSTSTIDEIYQVIESIYMRPLENPTEIDNSLTACSGALLGETLASREDWKRSSTSVLDDLQSSYAAPRVRQAKASALQHICEVNAEGLWTSEANGACRRALISAFSSPDVIVANAALRSAAHILCVDVDRELLSAVSRSLNHQSVEVRKSASIALGHVGSRIKLSDDLLKLMVPQLINGCKESNSAVRSASELALVYALRMQKNEDRFEEYRSTLEGVVQKNLDEIRVALSRVVRNGDLELETLCTTLSVY